jgi:hypothetical protein
MYPGMGTGVVAEDGVRVMVSMTGVGVAYGDGIHGEVTTILLDVENGSSKLDITATVLLRWARLCACSDAAA